MELSMVDADPGLSGEPSADGSDALEQFVERHGAHLYRLALHISGAESDAMGVVEDTLQAAVATIGSCADPSAFGSWIYRSVIRSAHDGRARRRPVDTAVLDDVVPPLNADGHFEPMIDWSGRIERQAQAFVAAIDELPADYRTALILHDVEGASKVEIAEILGTDVPVVAARLHRARLFVRSRLSRHFEHASFTPSTA